MFRRIFSSRARHPLARLVAAVIAGAALIVVLTFSLFAAAALVVGGFVFVLFNALRGKPRSAGAPRAAAQGAAPGAGVIEGEFTVLHGAQPAQRQAQH